MSPEDRANFIALVEAHEELVAKIKTVSRHYFVEAVLLDRENPERTKTIGDALDDLHLPVENNIKRLRTFLAHVENHHQSRSPAETAG
jgi:hypothetical protein